MRNVLGENLTLTLFGESHGDYIGATLDGFPCGIKVDEQSIKFALTKRRPILGLDTPRIEEDEFQIISGVFNGFTTGMPITILIKNKNFDDKPYFLNETPRPGHVDYVSFEKYGSYMDYRGGGHFSGRLTAPIVALSDIIIQALKEKGIYIGTHLIKCGRFYDDKMDSIEDLEKVNSKNKAIVKDDDDLLIKEIQNAQMNHDSLGGILETKIIGLPVGVGEPVFSSLEGNISKAIFSIGGVKGIEFGDGFDFATKFGSEVKDEFAIKEGKVITLTNHNGGINGGISNGMPITFRCVVKPTVSISQKQKTVNLIKKENTEMVINGQHDPAFVRRVPIVVTSLTAFTLLDLLLTRFGQDYFKKERI